MKILMVNPFDLWTATGIRLINIGNVLYKCGYDVTLISTKSENSGSPQKILFDHIEVPPIIGIKEKELIKGIGIRRINFTISSIFKFFHLLGKDYDIIHSSKTIPHATFPSLITKELRKKKVVIDWDDWEGKEGLGKFMPPLIREFNTTFEKKCIHKANGVIVDSKFLLYYLRKINYRKPVAYLPNGINLKEYQKVKRIELPKNSIVYVGRLGGVSELDYVLKNVKEALKKVDLNLLVIGEGERKEFFKKLCKKMNIEKHVKFLGWVEEKKKREILKSADIALMPMRNSLINKARSPMKLCEYMALGCAIVADPVGEVKEMLGEDYFIAEKMSEAIVKLLEDKKLRYKLKRISKRRAKFFDWNILVKKVEPFYERILRGV